MDISSLVNTSYSRVIFDYAKKNNRLKEMNEQAHYVLEVLTCEKEMIYEILRNYNISKEYRKNMLRDLFKDKLDKYFLYTLETIVDFNRCSNILTIIKRTLHLFSKALNIRYIKIVSAYKLTDKQKAKLQIALKKHYKADQIDINNLVVPSIIGGIKVISEEDSINTSYISKLINIRNESIKSLSRYKQKEDK